MWISRKKYEKLEADFADAQCKLKREIDSNVEEFVRYSKLAKQNDELRGLAFRQSVLIREWQQKYCDEVQKRLDLMEKMEEQHGN